MAHPGLGQAPAGAMRSWGGPKGWGAASRQGSPVTTRGLGAGTEASVPAPRVRRQNLLGLLHSAHLFPGRPPSSMAPLPS